MRQEKELAGIEILRFICAFAVLIWHYQEFFVLGVWDPNMNATVRSAQPLYAELFPFYDHGLLAVRFFWVISGFIFYWHYSAAIGSGTIRFSEFLVRRFSRLYPLHFATLILVALGQVAYSQSHRGTFIYSGNTPIAFASQLLFASNWFEWQPLTFNGPIWSVSVEILIYIAFFFTARAFGSRAAVALLAAAAFSICFNFLHCFIHPNVFACGMSFFAGGFAQRLSVRPAPLQIAGFVALATPAVVVFGRHATNGAYLLLLAMSVVIVMTKMGEGLLRVPFRHLAFLGNATYSSYLLHFPLQLLIVLVVDAAGWRRDIFNSPIALVGYLCGVVALSLLVHRHFEMPVQSRLRELGRPLLGRGLVAAEDVRNG
jgi:peptidoglycan/LPS O-acetylase OafA/YrhL